MALLDIDSHSHLTSFALREKAMLSVGWTWKWSKRRNKRYCGCIGMATWTLPCAAVAAPAFEHILDVNV